AARVHPVVQVPREEFGRRYGVRGCGGSYAIAESLVGKEEERPVAAVVDLWNVYPPANSGAKIVLFLYSIFSREKAPRVEVLVAQELVGVAVKLVRARFGDKANRAAGSVSGLGLESAGFHAEFGKRLHGRGVDLPPTHLRVRACDGGGGA